jgi:molybdopterin/thiamine biosynthesis adenylyltransferase
VVRPVRVHVVPVLRDLERVAAALGAGTPEVFLSDLGAGALPAGRLRLDGGVELLLVASEAYPTLPPVLLVTPEGGATEQLPVPWRLDTHAEERLVEAVRSIFSPPGPYRRAFAPHGGGAVTRDPERARAAGWEVRYTGQDAEARAEELRAALFARSAGLLSQALRDRAVLVAGCGSVGSYVAEQLVRSGAGAVTLLDPEPVEPENLSRATYDVEDLGRPKVEALARRLLRIAPALQCTSHAQGVEALGPAALDAAVRSADLVVAATDDPAAQRTLNRFAYGRGKPALFVGLYAGAEGGEVLLTVPGRTPCYLCATRTRHEAERTAGRVARELDYGTARLRGEMALGADVQHVASAAVKLGLSLLVPDGPGAGLRRFAEEVVAQGMTYLTLSMVPRYWFYPRVFEGAAGQGAYQSVWLTPSPCEECPVCGAPEHRVDPLDAPLRAPSRAAFAGLARTHLPDT